MYLYSIIAPAGDAHMPVSLQCFATTRLPLSDVRGSRSTPPEVALLATTDLGIAFLPACQPAAYAIRSLPHAEWFPAYDAPTDFPVLVSPSCREVTLLGAIFRVEASCLSKAYVERFPTPLARPIATRRLPAGNPVGSLVPGWLARHRELAGIRTVCFAAGTSELGTTTLACFFEALHTQLYQCKPQKERYYVQAVRNIKAILSTEGEEQADLFAGLEAEAETADETM